MTLSPALAAFLPYLAMALFFAAMVRRTGRARPIRLWALWLGPLLLAFAAGLYVYGAILVGPAHGAEDFYLIALAALAGIGIGSAMAHGVIVSRCAETGRPQAASTRFAVSVIGAILIAREAARLAGWLPPIGHAEIGLSMDLTLAAAISALVTRQVLITRKVKRLTPRDRAAAAV
jgi:hypothetical protein